MVLGIGVMGASVALGAGLFVALELVTTAGTLQSSADHIALAASDVARGIHPGRPCAIAGELAKIQAHHLDQCVIDRGHAEVVVSTKKWGLHLQAGALAGPPDSDVWGEGEAVPVGGQ